MPCTREARGTPLPHTWHCAPRVLHDLSGRAFCWLEKVERAPERFSLRTRGASLGLSTFGLEVAADSLKQWLRDTPSHLWTSGANTDPSKGVQLGTSCL